MDVGNTGGWYMKRVWAILFLLFLMSATAPPASVETDILANGELEVTHSPNSLWLRPRETDEFEMRVKNVGDRHLNVSLEYLQIECPGGTGGTFSRSFLSLEPGAKETVTVEVTSYANILLGSCRDDTRIMFWWGPNLTVDQEGHVEHSSAEDSEIVTFDIHSQLSIGMMIIIIIIIVIVLVIFMRWRSKDQGDLPERPT
jgi:uncharacterized membrane protein